MSIDSRLTRLRALVDRLERLPASTQRQWMLSEARARMVDVETGEAPRAMRPLAEDSLAGSGERRSGSIAGPTPAKRSVALRSRQPKPADETPADLARVGSDASTAPLGITEVLWAEDWQADASPAAPADEGDAESRPWRRGLRG